MRTPLKIFPFKREDLPNLSHLQPEDWQDIIPHFDFYTSSSFCHPVKMAQGIHIAGIGCAIKFPTSGWLAHIIVDPAYRNRGIGTDITRYLMEWLQKNNCNTLQLIATDAGEPIYRKLGFKPILKYLFYSGICSERLESIAIHSFEDKYREEILKLDRYVTGDDRKELLHAHLPSLKIYIGNERIQGYYAPFLGEGQILATKSTAGIELLKLKHYKSNTRTVIPEKNFEATEFLSQPGFRFERNALRMVFGKTWKWHPENIYSRIGGNLG
jgi:GNAT superfamily N-acetyltransferase